MRKLLIVSNRLPWTFVDCEQQEGRVGMSAGGLATALRAVARQRPVRWIGWAGADYDPSVRDIIASSVALNCDFVPLCLSEADRREFYSGFCNEIIWPLFHNLPPTSSFEPAYWRRYLDVNARYADLICREASADDFVWIHDYHLMLQGKLLSTRRNRVRLAFFLHIPFPPADVFAKLPWKLEILDSLLSFGTVGFQTAQDRQNFLDCAVTYFPRVEIRRNGATPISVIRGQYRTLVRHCPISIDFDEFANLASQPQVTAEAERIREVANVRRLVLGIDRLDYTKGIPGRLVAFRDVLTRYAGLRHEISLLQVVVPSRENVPRYQELKNHVEDLVKGINGEFGTSSWVPVRYQYGHLSREQLVAHYRAADIALVTPLKDGMNLVAKEFCASRVDETGILILSKFAGAAIQLRTGAYLVDPRDPASLASAIYDAVDPDEGDERRRMRRMRRNIKGNDIHRWCDEMLKGTSVAQGDLTSRKSSVKLELPNSWTLQIPQLSVAASGETP